MARASWLIDKETGKRLAYFATDRAGWAEIHGLADLWERVAAATAETDPFLSGFFEYAAAETTAHTLPELCKAVGGKTHRPCRWDKNKGPCPLHDVPTVRCGHQASTGTVCAWNTTRRGPCPQHDPVLKEQRAKARREAIPKPAKRGEATPKPPKRSLAKVAKRAAPPVKASIWKDVECPRCGSGPGQRCRYPNGSETTAHRVRRLAALQAMY
ncbi:zinc finger domain-containing protein [Streptomyces virginiae]|uniref:zinc finger domain-containing protein n=1 Tax=Streptomyces virginiae TaxID=1961 RepID=UPI004064A716